VGSCVQRPDHVRPAADVDCDRSLGLNVILPFVLYANLDARDLRKGVDRVAGHLVLRVEKLAPAQEAQPGAGLRLERLLGGPGIGPIEQLRAHGQRGAGFERVTPRARHASSWNFLWD